MSKYHIAIWIFLSILFVFSAKTNYAAFPVQRENLPVQAPVGFEVNGKGAAYAKVALGTENTDTEDRGWLGITAISLGVAGLLLLVATLVFASPVLAAAFFFCSAGAAILGAVGMGEINSTLATIGMILGVAELAALVVAVIVAVVIAVYLRL